MNEYVSSDAMQGMGDQVAERDNQRHNLRLHKLDMTFDDRAGLRTGRHLGLAMGIRLATIEGCQ